MIRHSLLLATPELQISRYDHPAGHHHHDPKEEVALEYSVNRVEVGHFILQIEGRGWELRRGDLFLNYPGMVYRCRHAELEPTDVCTSIALDSQGINKEMTVFERAARRRPIPAPTNRFAYLFLLAARSTQEPMAAEEAAREVIMEAADEPCTPSKAYREHQLSWYAERVDAARQLLDRRYTDEHNLGRLARSVGMSSFHFARIFRELVGMPPHAYLCRARLRYAALRLREGASVTEACFSSGFHNLSHFSRRFQRQFGIRPSNYSAQMR